MNIGGRIRELNRLDWQAEQEARQAEDTRLLQTGLYRTRADGRAGVWQLPKGELQGASRAKRQALPTARRSEYRTDKRGRQGADRREQSAGGRSAAAGERIITVSGGDFSAAFAEPTIWAQPDADTL